MERGQRGQLWNRACVCVRVCVCVFPSSPGQLNLEPAGATWQLPTSPVAHDRKMGTEERKSVPTLSQKDNAFTLSAIHRHRRLQFLPRLLGWVLRPQPAGTFPTPPPLTPVIGHRSPAEWQHWQGPGPWSKGQRRGCGQGEDAKETASSGQAGPVGFLARVTRSPSHCPHTLLSVDRILEPGYSALTSTRYLASMETEQERPDRRPRLENTAVRVPADVQVGHEKVC